MCFMSTYSIQVCGIFGLVPSYKNITIIFCLDYSEINPTKIGVEFLTHTRYFYHVHFITVCILYHTVDPLMFMFTVYLIHCTSYAIYIVI